VGCTLIYKTGNTTIVPLCSRKTCVWLSPGYQRHDTEIHLTFDSGNVAVLPLAQNPGLRGEVQKSLSGLGQVFVSNMHVFIPPKKRCAIHAGRLRHSPAQATGEERAQAPFLCGRRGVCFAHTRHEFRLRSHCFCHGCSSFHSSTPIRLFLGVPIQQQYHYTITMDACILTGWSRFRQKGNSHS
jgi:hypothetical protein